MATLTVCEQAAADLADINAAIKATLTGKRLTGIRHADKGLDFYAAANMDSLLQERRRLQLIVNRCNGVSSPFILNTPSDG